MRNSEYWKRRMKLMEDALKLQVDDYVQNIEEQFDAAIRDIDTQIRAWYQRFAGNNGISYAGAQKLLSADELAEFHWAVDEFIKRAEESGVSGAWLRELENASARVHISRLESLKFRLQARAEELTGKRIQATEEASRLAYTDSYYQTVFEIQKGLGVGWTMGGVDTRRLEKLLSRPWTADDQTFTARCWTDKSKLVDTVNRELTRMVATGEAPDRAIAAISKQLGVSKSNAGRVVMTESTYFASAAQRDCFSELDVERYEIVAALDRHTCEICGSMDGKVFPMNEYEAGNTAPPFHPWCRCCTAPYFEDMEGLGKRAARDVVDGEGYEVPADMTYPEWKKLQDAKYGEGTVDAQRKKVYNENAEQARQESIDREQYERYRDVLRERCPDSFEEFQKIKHSDAATYGRLKHEYRIINRYEVEGDVSAETILKLDEAAYTAKRNGFIPDGYSGNTRKRIRNMASSGNVAVMSFDGRICFSHSQANYEGTPEFDSYVLGDSIQLIGAPEHAEFEVLDLGDGIPRGFDTEAKLLEYASRKIGGSERKMTITILSEKHICDSCSGVVEQFRKKHPSVTVNIVSGKRGYNGSAKGLKTWKHR